MPVAGAPLPAREGGFPPEVWGPSVWKTLHFMAAAYPVQPSAQEKKAMYAFLQALRFLLPCAGCKHGYDLLTSSPGPLKLTPGVVRDRATVFAWTVRVHDAVNAKLRKPARKTVQEWYRTYDRLRAG